MKTTHSASPILGFIFVFAMFIISNGRTLNSINEMKRAVNRGGWLVVEGWMKPSLFRDIPNKDFLVCFVFNFSVFPRNENSNCFLITRKMSFNDKKKMSPTLKILV